MLLDDRTESIASKFTEGGMDRENMMIRQVGLLASWLTGWLAGWLARGPVEDYYHCFFVRDNRSSRDCRGHLSQTCPLLYFEPVRSGPACSWTDRRREHVPLLRPGPPPFRAVLINEKKERTWKKSNKARESCSCSSRPKTLFVRPVCFWVVGNY